MINVSHVVLPFKNISTNRVAAPTRPHALSSVHADPRTDLPRAPLHRHTRTGQSRCQAHRALAHRAQTQSARPHDHGPVRARHQSPAAQVLRESTTDALPAQAWRAETAPVASGGHADGQDLRLQQRAHRHRAAESCGE